MNKSAGVQITSAPDVAPDAVTAQINARVSHHRVEVLSERTPTTQVFINPNGTVTSEIASAPVRVKDSTAADGWADIDLDLARNADGSVSPKVPLTDVTLNGGGTDVSDLVSYEGPKDNSFSLDWEGSLPKPTLDGPVATYANVEPNVDLQVTATRFGFEESFIVKKRPTDPSALELPLAVGTHRLTISDPDKSSTSGMTVKDDAGKTVGTISPAETWDASTDPSGEPDNTTVSGLALQPSDSGTALVVKPDAGFLSDPTTTYPVVVDPSFTTTSVSDTYVRSDMPTTNYETSTELDVGTPNSGGSKYRTYLKFDGPRIDNTLVTSATVKLWDFYSNSCTPSNLNLYASSYTNLTIATWNSYQPVVVGSTVTTTSAAQGYSSSCAANWLTLDATPAVNYLVGQKANQYTFGIQASETANSGWKRFDSSATVHVPVLTVNYDSYPNVPSGIYVLPTSLWGGSGYTSSSSPTLVGYTSDPDGQPARLNYEVWDGPSTTSNTRVATCSSSYVVSGAAASCNPSPALSDTKTYYVRAQAQSSYANMYSGWSDLSAVSFRTSLSTPQAPSISCASYANGSWTTTVPQSSVTCTVSTTGGNGYSAPVIITGDVDGSAFSQQVTMGASASFQVSVPATNGSHTVTAQSYSAVGATQAAPMTYTFGYGTASMTGPAPGLTTANYVSVFAGGPPRGTGSVSAAMNWRVAGTSAWSSDIPITGSSLQTGTGSGPVSVNGFRWSTVNATGTNINPRRPTLLELRVCFSYSSPSTVQCTDSTGPAKTVLRVPHAFGDGFPTAAAGEGTVALWSGEFAFDTTDANVATNLGPLVVSRSHSSFLDPQNVATGVFGPGWSASFGDSGDVIGLQVDDSTTVDGTIAFVSDDSDPLVFREPGAGTTKAPTGAYTPVGDVTTTSGYSLASSGSGASQTLVLTASDGSTSTWGPVDPNAAQLTWQPVATTQPENHSTVTYSTDGAGHVTRILAPVPSGVTCGAGTALNAGCSALFIAYTGSGASTRVSSISYDNWDPSASAMTTTLIASYVYDGNGMLTSERDERLGLSTSYQYATYGSNVVVTRVTHDGFAPYIYNYDNTNGVLRLANVQRGPATSGGATVTTASFVYAAPMSTAGFPDLSTTQVVKWGQDQVHAPTAAYAVFGMDHPVSSINASDLGSSDWPYATLHFTNDDGYETDTDTYGAGRWLTTALFYDSAGRFETTLDPNNTYAASNGTLADFNAGKSFTRWNADITDGSGNVILPAHTYVTDTWSPVQMATISGQSQSIRIHTHYDYDEGAPNSDINSVTGKPYQLVTTTTVGASAPVNYSETPGASLAPDVLTTAITKTAYDPIDGASSTGATSGWTLGQPTATTIVMPNSADNIVHKTRYDGDGNVIETRAPGSSGTDAGTTKSIYYTAGTNADDATCGNQPQWAGLSCWTGPAAPPESGTDIPDTRVTNFDRWLDPKTTVETSGPSGSGQATRTTTQTYLADGRLDTTALATANITGSTPLPTTKVLYDSATKMPLGTANLDSGGSQTSAVTSTIDQWGRTASYTDASGNTTTTTYVAPGTPGAGSVSAVTNTKGTTSYTYDGTDATGNTEHRGLPTQLAVSGLGTYSAAYDAAGNLTTETMPGSVSQNRTYDSIGRLTGLTYSGQGGTLLGYTRSYNGTGQVDTDVDSTGRTTNFGYDRAGRLNSVADTFTNAVAQTSTCTTRGYTFDARGNRTGLSTTTGSTCAWTGATKTWAYDAYSRQLSGANGSGTYVYDAFGRQTTVPASDSANATNAATTIAYYDDNTVRSIAQSGGTTTYGLDPVGRRLTATTSSATTVDAYSDTSDSPDWVTKTQGSTVTTSRYVSDLAGGLTNVDTTGTTTTATLQLSAPNGAIAATIQLPSSGPATGITSYATYDEYGQPLSGSTASGAARYGWHGSAQREVTDSGLMLMGARLYNSSTGRFTSTDPVAGGNEDAYNYPNDPIDANDLTGAMIAPQGGGPSVLDELPHAPGIYRLTDDQGNTYVGSSVDMRNRLVAHIQRLGARGRSITKAEVLEPIARGRTSLYRRFREQVWINRERDRVGRDHMNNERDAINKTDFDTIEESAEDARAWQRLQRAPGQANYLRWWRGVSRGGAAGAAAEEE